jgi:hypothetical protein
LRTCYNCGHLNNFISQCPYENREDHGGKIIPKDKSKAPHKKTFVKKNPTNKKTSKYVLVTGEEYSFGDADDQEDTSSEAAAIYIAPTPSTSLFESMMATIYVYQFVGTLSAECCTRVFSPQG